MMDKVDVKPIRDEQGYFAKGNRGGPGNPWFGTVQKLRVAVFKAISEGDIGDIVKTLIVKAKKGDIKAAQLLFDITGIRIKHIEATVTSVEMTPDEASEKVDLFFGRK